MYQLLWFLLLCASVISAENTTTTLSRGFVPGLNVSSTELDPIAKETDVVIVYPNITTFTIGEVYQDALDMRPTRVSAISLSSIDASYLNSHSLTESVQATSFATAVPVGPSVSNVSFISSSTSATVSKLPLPITDELTGTRSTSTSVIFSSSGTVDPSVTEGTSITTIESKPQPLVTQDMSSSVQSVTVDVSTLSSAHTVTDQGNTQKTATSTFTSTATSIFSSSLLSLVSSVDKNTTMISYSLIPVDVTTTTEITSTSVSVSPTLEPEQGFVDLFSAVDTTEPPSVFGRAANPMDLAAGVDNGNLPIETNKFYTNLIVGSQQSSAFVYPYVIFRNDDGLAIQHTSSAQYGFTDRNSLVNPVNIASLIISSEQFQGVSNFKMSEMYHSSCNVQLVSNDDVSSYIETPLVQGMGFVTSVFHGTLTPLLRSAVGISTLTLETSNNLADGILKYRISLLNGVDWLLYITVPDSHSSDEVDLSIEDGSVKFTLSSPIDGLIIQISEAPEKSDLEIYYDSAAGMYLTTMQLSGASDSTVANYKFAYQTEGKSSSGSTMIFVLPHHLKSLTDVTLTKNTGISMDSTTKGKMTGFLTTELAFTSALNNKVSWLPWSEQLGDNELIYSAEQLRLLATVANEEIQVNIKSSISGLNTYYLGKILDKYAFILLTLSDIVKDEDVTKETLQSMKEAFELLTSNTQLYPLLYDTKFGGIITSGDLSSTTTQYDFGATYYNDHHFHYGYIIHAAAVIGYVDSKYGQGDWASNNNAWVSSLIRDVCNPSLSDSYFPQFRMFDWFHGHSWASGLFENGNGKNEESSSEDYHFAYGMKLWGQVTNDDSMNRLGSLMLNVMHDSMGDYMLYEDSNTVEPARTVSNKVSGILFDSLIDYTTYFGLNTEYIHGIHMLPLTAASGLIRSTAFVREEWDQKLSPIIDSVQSGWTGILRLNQALFDPQSAYDFFAQDGFSSSTYLDNGMSRTWALAFTGGLANSA